MFVSTGRVYDHARPIPYDEDTPRSLYWGEYAKNKIATPANANPRDAFIAGKVAMWIAGSWNVSGLREAKVDFTVAPVPKLFKQPIVFTIPHQFSFPKPKTQDAARRETA